MNIKIEDIMAKRVVTATPHQTAAHIRELLSKKKINVVPVVGPEKEVLGIISSADLLNGIPDGKPIGQFMTTKVYTIPKYNDVELAARMMRKHKIHHLVVTDEKKLVGVLSSFDLLQLIEGKRFTIKNAPTNSAKKKAGSKRL